jgi:orotate phosphoribosyltransferase-like protein
MVYADELLSGNLETASGNLKKVDEQLAFLRDQITTTGKTKKGTKKIKNKNTSSSCVCVMCAHACSYLLILATSTEVNMQAS